MSFIKTARVMGTTNNVISDEFQKAKSQKTEGETFWQGVAGGVVDVLIVAHREKIAAGLRRAGFDIGDDEPLNEKTIVTLVAKKTGIDLTSFDPDEIKSKVIAYLSKDLSERIGFDIDLSQGLGAAVDAAAAAAIASGRANKLVQTDTAKSIRELAAAAAAGLSVEGWRKMKNAKKQKKYRAGKSFMWVAR